MELTIHSDGYYMGEALKQAQLAAEAGEVPVGAVVVSNKRIIARAHNQTEQLSDPSAHAEMLALTAACHHLGAKYLNQCTMYVTLEPCLMCGAAMYWAQLGTLVYAVNDPKRGYARVEEQVLHPKTKVVTGVLESESKRLLNNFFAKLRN